MIVQARPVGTSISARDESSSPVRNDGGDFSSMLSSLAHDAGASLAQAEKTSVDAIHGLTSSRELVDSLMKAEQTLQTVLAVRDKAVSAIQDITKMAI